jgi:hypothetical protein
MFDSDSENPSELLPPPAAAAYVNLSENTLAGGRSYGTGPAYIKIGGRIFYMRSDLDAWIASRRVKSTAEGRALPKLSVRAAQLSGGEAA